MGTRDLLADLTGAGFTVAADGERLVIRPASQLTDDLRQRLRDSKADLLALLASPPKATEGLRSAATDGEAPEAPPHPLRVVWLARMAMLGMDEGESLALADDLEDRDKRCLSVRSCIECSHLGDSRRCLASAVGRLRGVDRRFEPMLRELQRCEAFGLRKGMQ